MQSLLSDKINYLLNSKKAIYSLIIVCVLIGNLSWLNQSYAQTNDLPSNVNGWDSALFQQWEESLLNTLPDHPDYDPRSSLIDNYLTLIAPGEIASINAQIPQVARELNAAREILYNNGVIALDPFGVAQGNVDRLEEQFNNLLVEREERSEFHQQASLYQINSALANPNLTPAEQQELEAEREQISGEIATHQQTSQNLNQQTNTILQNSPDSIQSKKSVCVNLTSFNPIACINVVASTLLDILSILLSWIGSLFNLSIWYSIIKFSYLANLEFVDWGWKICRDLANISFIFILLYIAISTILQLSSGDTKKLLTWVIITALLVNFSAMFTKIAIDASNILSLTFYNNIGETTSNNDQAKNIAGSFITKTNSEKLVKGGNETETGILARNMGKIILTVITAFVMLSASVLFIIRAIVLLIIIITAPLAFMGLALPKYGSNIFGKWNKELTAQALFAPVFMLFFFITLKIVENSDQISSPGGAIDQGVAGIIMYIFLIGMMIYSIIIAKSLGAHGGSWAEKFVTGKSKAVGFGALGMAGAYTVGRKANQWNDSDKMKNFVSKNPFIGGVIRNAVQKTAKVGFGSGRGYNQRIEERQKEQKEQAEYLKKPELQAEYINNLMFEKDKKKAYENLTDRQKADMENALRAQKQKIGNELRNKGKSEDEIKKATENETKLIEMLATFRKGLKGEKADAIEKMMGEQMVKEFRRIEGDDKDTAGNVVKTEAQKQIEYVLSFDEADRKLLYQSMGERERAELEVNATDKERGKDSAGTPITEKALIIQLKESLTADNKAKTEKALGEISKTKNVDEAKKELAKLLNEDTINDNKVIEQLEKLTSKQIALLDKDILLTEGVVKHLDKKDLEAINKGGELDRQTKKDLHKLVEEVGTPEAKEYLGISPIQALTSKKDERDPAFTSFNSGKRLRK